MGEPMTIDEARRVAGAAAIAAEDGMTPLPGAVTRDALATLAAEVDRLRSLPVLTECGDCGWFRGDDGSCKLARTVIYAARRAPPPSECPLRGKAGER